MKNTLRLGIIGCGSIANAHANALAQLTDKITVTTVCDPLLKNAEKMAAVFGLRADAVHTVFDEAAVRADTDAYLLTTPHDLHYPQARQLLENGKHILVEKPFTHNAQQAEELVELAERKGCKLAVGHCQRHSPMTLAIKRELEEGNLGNIFGVFTTSLQYLPMYVPAESNHWLYSAKVAGGGIIISVAVHRLDMMRFLLGEVESVSASFEVDEGRSSAQRPFEWTAGVNFRFAQGAVGAQFCCYKAMTNAWVPETLAFYGSEGTIRAAEDSYEIYRPSVDKEFRSVTPVGTDKWVAQLEAFHAEITAGVPNRASGRDAIGTMRLIDAIYQSGSKGGERVYL
jgi:predicted dehydrogenase